MPTVPEKAIDKVQFYENHESNFSTNAVAIGITALEATDLATKTSDARAAYDVQQAAKQAAKVATEDFQNKVTAMGTAGAAIIKKIRAKAEATGDPNVYTLAAIPAPPTPTARPTPEAPSDFKAFLGAMGLLTLKWQCVTHGGSVVYQVWRQVGPTGTLEYVGGSGKREFIDSTIPAGTSQITYSIQAVRSSGPGPFAEFLVKFGTPEEGGLPVAMVQPSVKKAA